jgi:hypothetical protein
MPRSFASQTELLQAHLAEAQAQTGSVPYISISPAVIHHSATIQGPTIVTLSSHTLPARHDRRWGGRHLKQLTCCQNIPEGRTGGIITRVQTSWEAGHIFSIHLLFSCSVFEFPLLHSGLLAVITMQSVSLCYWRMHICNKGSKYGHSKKFMLIQPSGTSHFSAFRVGRYSLTRKTLVDFGQTSFQTVSSQYRPLPYKKPP